MLGLSAVLLNVLREPLALKNCGEVRDPRERSEAGGFQKW